MKSGNRSCDKSSNSGPTTAVALLNPSGTVNCTHCQKSHPSAKCQVVSNIAARRNLLRKQGRCFLCLRKKPPCQRLHLTQQVFKLFPTLSCEHLPTPGPKYKFSRTITSCCSEPKKQGKQRQLNSRNFIPQINLNQSTVTSNKFQ